MNEIVRVRCLKHVYPDATEVSVCGLDFVVHEGEKVVILGSNGSGKTTLLAHIIGLLKATEGEIKVFGKVPTKEFDEVILNIGVVFQNVDEQIIGPTVEDDIAFVLRNRGVPSNEVDERVNAMMETIGITNLRSKIPHYLSGGEKKKVALAGALIANPALLVLDEPFKGLDPIAKEEIIKLLSEINTKHKSALVITTHEVNLVPRIADVVYVLSGGNIIARGNPKEIFLNPHVLHQANMQPPDFLELFFNLQKMGLNVELPSTMEEATEILARLLNKNRD
ncbi:energy-coupling factor ABC transporter ATP-binding protein [Candidatus Oleimmundimicrobium sp.]|uniref:energy-coupling factor ABC transporter ATP-binding protein n=1 Tax=Candidatus Oleimmundimicrobium sp. TaxID=3060597 RepID=UPI00271E8643|nr:energy-coupling factor ABC transporter ATP-binding protein [Candidatus Oleimmundimicrobium sp.]MDO8886601.1 energy-coupling factor ABC transporter ATP-binding protein [Candidatus Oleimmundimicrobium sp.]